jgi:hypothetical protein
MPPWYVKRDSKEEAVAKGWNSNANGNLVESARRAFDVIVTYLVRYSTLALMRGLVFNKGQESSNQRT